eukprot:TRINITY_DN44170_c0_g1_i1.p3 TRINITY_DN44170_c0_g1~~TRINITY_DN44170_c0_g1_i1.p3  ORF type:complete len:125 (+),score=0.38 TRINITY_DN44170_c0_g1_i1:167-541(+)
MPLSGSGMELDRQGTGGSPQKPWQVDKLSDGTGESPSRPWAGRGTGVRDRERQIRSSLQPRNRSTRPPRRPVVAPPEMPLSKENEPVAGADTVTPSQAAVWAVRLAILCGTVTGARYVASRLGS